VSRATDLGEMEGGGRELRWNLTAAHGGKGLGRTCFFCIFFRVQQIG